ncbi:MAG: glycosyl hydrolase family 79 C-terminal domain-containing protein [Solirubrobacteraceae bacterium]
MRVRCRHVVLLLIAAWVGVAGPASARSARNTPGAPVAVTVDPAATVGHIRPGFLGVSIEYWAFEYSAGKHLNDLDSVFVQLIRNLEHDHQSVLRIGGGSSDTTWWPVHGFKRPPGVNYALSSNRLAIMKAVAQQLGVRLMLGINFAAHSLTLAAAEAHAMVSQIGASRINSLELGNEPELYGNPAFPWYRRANGTPVPARRSPYDLHTFINDFRHYGARFPRVPLAGPASNGGTWLGTNLSQFISSEPRLGVVTLHRYPFQACFVDPAQPHFPTFARMLSPAASIGQAQGLQPYLAAAHAHHLPFVVDEMNTISCGDPPGLANTFAMALWALDTLFAHAQAGVDAVDIHTWPGAIYRLFTNCDWPSTPIHCGPFKNPTPGWQAMVEPEYYGLLMFARAAPTGSHLLATTSSNPAVRAWATKARNGTERIVLINDDMASSHLISVHLPGATVQATEQQLLAPGVGATGGVTLGGQSFASPTHTGLLSGPSVTPMVTPSAGVYTVRLPAASASLLTLG